MYLLNNFSIFCPVIAIIINAGFAVKNSFLAEERLAI
jgi:hypothetical protein